MSCGPPAHPVLAVATFAVKLAVSKLPPFAYTCSLLYQTSPASPVSTCTSARFACPEKPAQSSSDKRVLATHSIGKRSTLMVSAKEFCEVLPISSLIPATRMSVDKLALGSSPAEEYTIDSVLE